VKFDRRHQCGGGQDAISQERHAVEIKLSHLQSEFLFDLSLTLQAPLDIGLGPEGHRLIIMTSGGRFQGPRLSGTVLPLTGADWPRIRSDGTFAIDARACFRTTEGALIYVTYGGRLVVPSPELLPAVLDITRDDPVDPSSYYFRTHMTFETSDASTAWLNGVLAVGVGRIGHGGRGISRPPGAVKRLMASTSELERRVLWVWIP
jgi:hypothetical protein